MPLIEVIGVSHSYPHGTGRRQVLRDVSVAMPESRVGVIGANGSGKSTFARLLNGLVVPEVGRVLVDGHDTRREGRTVRRLVGFCFTDPDAQIVMPTVREDVGFGLRRRGAGADRTTRRRGAGADRTTRRRGAGADQTTERIDRTLAEFGLADHADHAAHLLSGGQKQLLALASVLVTEPAVLIMDEPTTLLDLRNAEAVGRIVASLPQQVILLTHHLDLLKGFDRVLVFDAGRIVADDAPAAAIAAYRERMR